MKLSKEGKIRQQQNVIMEQEREIIRLKATIVLYDNNDQYLNDKIDKAIELMYNKGTFNLDTEYGKVFSELLDILQGSDKE